MLRPSRRGPRDLILGVVMFALIAAGCSTGGASDSGEVKVVAGFYPLDEAARVIGGRHLSVTNVTPAGAEPHDLELNPKQVDQVLDASLAIVMGRGFQPAVEKTAAQRDRTTLVVLDRLPIGAKGKKVPEPGKERAPGALDPHVWLDPVLMARIVDDVRAELAKINPRNRLTYDRNARAFNARLAQLDQQYRSGLANCQRDVIVTSHEAFGWLARRYGLVQQGVAGLSPDAEPDPKRLAALTDLVRREGVTTVFTETLVSPRIADTLAREAGVKTQVLNPLEGLTSKEIKAGDDYVSVMRTNLSKLGAALGCRVRQ